MHPVYIADQLPPKKINKIQQVISKYDGLIVNDENEEMAGKIKKMAGNFEILF